MTNNFTYYTVSVITYIVIMRMRIKVFYWMVVYSYKGKEKDD